MANFEVVTSRLGNIGHAYYVPAERNFYVMYSSYSKNGKIYVKCKNKECEARGTIEKNNFTRTRLSPHNHEDHADLKEAIVAYHKMKLSALTGNINVPLREIFDNHFEGLSNQAKVFLNFRSKEWTLRNIRVQRFPSCRSIADLDMLMDTNDNMLRTFGKYIDQPFYRGTVGINGREQQRATIFIIEEHLNILQNGSTLYADGTDTLGWPRPLAFILMTHRTAALYEIVFTFLRDSYDIEPSNHYKDS
jgi:hypothetical protein